MCDVSECRIEVFTSIGLLFHKNVYLMTWLHVKYFFQNYFNRHRRPYKILLFHRVETCLKLFQNHSRDLL